MLSASESDVFKVAGVQVGRRYKYKIQRGIDESVVADDDERHSYKGTMRPRLEKGSDHIYADTLAGRLLLQDEIDSQHHRHPSRDVKRQRTGLETTVA